MRLSVECAFPYLRKRGAVSRKSAFCAGGLTEKRTLRFSDRANCAFPSHCRPRGVGCNHPPGCGALSKVAQLGKCVRATTRQAAGRFAPGSANLVWSLTSRKVAVWVRSLGAQFGCAAWVDGLTGKRTLDQAGTPSVRRWPFPSGCTRDIRKCDGNPRPQNRAVAAHPIGEAEPSAVRGDDLGGDGKT